MLSQYATTLTYPFELNVSKARQLEGIIRGNLDKWKGGGGTWPQWMDFGGLDSSFEENIIMVNLLGSTFNFKRTRDPMLSLSLTSISEGRGV